MTDRRALRIVLAVLDLELSDLAELMGYRVGYVSNVLSGCASASDAFRRAFGDALTNALMGEKRRRPLYPAAPLIDGIRKRADLATCKTTFYERLGVTSFGLNKRVSFDETTVDRICCELGIHIEHIYPMSDLEAAS